MTPDVWLRHQGVLKLRSRHPDWTREDLLALAKQTVGTHVLDKKQLDVVCAVLRQERPDKPIAAFYGTETAEVQAVVAREVVWVNNGRFEPRAQACWELMGTHLAPAFDSAKAVFVFARALAATSPRESWGRLAREFRARTSLGRFHLPEGLPELPFHLTARKALDRRLAADARMTLPLPDSANIVKRYYGLEEGQVLPHADGGHQLVVTRVRVNLDAPPTLTFREEEIRHE